MKWKLQLLRCSWCSCCRCNVSQMSQNGNVNGFGVVVVEVTCPKCREMGVTNFWREICRLCSNASSTWQQPQLHTHTHTCCKIRSKTTTINAIVTLSMFLPFIRTFPSIFHQRFLDERKYFPDKKLF